MLEDCLTFSLGVYWQISLPLHQDPQVGGWHALCKTYIYPILPVLPAHGEKYGDSSQRKFLESSHGLNARDSLLPAVGAGG